MQSIGQNNLQFQNPYGSYNNQNQSQQDATQMPITNRLSSTTGISPESVDDPHNAGKNIATMTTEGFRGSNTGGNGMTKQSSWGQIIANSLTGGTNEGSQGGFSKYIGNGGADYSEIAKTGAAMLATGLQWVRKYQAADQQDRTKALNDYVNHVYQQDQAKQQNVQSNMNQQVTDSQNNAQTSEDSWQKQLDQINSNNATINAMWQAAQEQEGHAS